MGRALVISHTGPGTGFGRVATHIAQSLQAAGWAVESVVPGDGQNAGLRCANPTDLGVWAPVAAASRVAHDLIIATGSLPFLDWLLPEIRAVSDARLIPYVPTEGALARSGSIAGIAIADAVVAFHRFGIETLRFGIGSTSPQIIAIPHPTLFDKTPPYTAAERTTTRQRIFPNAVCEHNATWVLNANRHDPRKNLGATIRLIAQLADRDIEDVVLVMHGEVVSRGLSLAALARHHGIASQVLFTRNASSIWSDYDMVDLYRSCQIGINTASGEGWGLTAFEHAACGGAQILPDHAIQRELWDDSAIFLPTANSIHLDRYSMGRTVDEIAAADRLESYFRTGDRAQNGPACQTTSTQEKFSRATVAAQWVDLASLVVSKPGELAAFEARHP